MSLQHNTLLKRARQIVKLILAINAVVKALCWGFQGSSLKYITIVFNPYTLGVGTYQGDYHASVTTINA